MALAYSALNGVKVYNLSAGKTLPEWLDSTKTASNRTLRYNDEFRRRLELVQNFDFPTASTHICLSPDQRYIVACGVYRPQVKVFELDQLSMKFERHFDSEVVAMHVLSDDFSKMAFLRADRTIELHARYGVLHSVRVPKFGRDMGYNPVACDLYVGGASNELWRLNLEQGQFLGGFETDLKEINCISVNPVHQLTAVGGADSRIECWDPRDRTRSAALTVRTSSSSGSADISALEFAADGLTMAVGTDSGHCLLYDLRTALPLLDKDHRYGLPIKDIRFHEKSRQVVSTDGAIIKLWDRQSGEALTSIQTDAAVNKLCLVQGSGLIFGAGEQHRVPTFYIPELGPAPKWCAFLDNLTEELEEETKTSAFDDYKFVTRSELDTMGLSHLIGSNLLRAYMHGFFMDLRLWHKVKAVADPFEYETFIKKRVQEKIQAQRADRITLPKKLPKVNKDYAEALLQSASKSGSATNPLGDSRFASLFKDSEFAIDQESDEFVRLHPSNAKLGGVVDGKDDGRFAMVDESDDQNDDGKSSDDGSGSDTDDLFSNKNPRSKEKKIRNKPAKKKTMFEIKTQGTLIPLQPADAAAAAVPKKAIKLSMSERKRQLDDTAARKHVNAPDVGGEVKFDKEGSRSVTFTPKYKGSIIADQKDAGKVEGRKKQQTRRPVHFRK
uniref:Uncharacterized protein n=1 Tax=Spongospora subterranea TaxID=70186 RepID=A0A0H5RBM6_9EUKA|eukprot:CRZ11428.1 hypothetical protein [Spongospora subterranea]